MAKMVLHRAPVVVRHPLSDVYVSAKRGDEFPDDDPIVEAYPWLFVDEPEPARVDSVPVEQATAAPGERRATRRQR